MEIIQVVPNYSKREYGYGKAVAAVPRVSAEELGDDFIVVFCIQEETAISVSLSSRSGDNFYGKANWRIWLSRSYV